MDKLRSQKSNLKDKIIFCPGDPEKSMFNIRKKDGIPITKNLLSQINKLLLNNGLQKIQVL